MEEPKLQIPIKRYSGETAVVSVRMPKDMLGDIDRLAARSGRPRNELLLKCLEFAIDHIEFTEK